MNRTARILVVCSTLFFSILACTLPGSEPTQDFPPTPNATMTELYAQATILTPAFTEPTVVTSTPESFPSATTTFTAVAPGVTSTTAAPAGPTNTFTPPPTLTLSTPQRPAGVYSAKFLSTPPTIDGDWGEWTTTQFGANIVVFGLDNWVDGEDLESAFRVGWDNNNLYIAVKVRDDKYVQNATGADLYKGDSIELLLDLDLYGDYNTTALSADDYQLGISPGKGSPGGVREAYLWYPTNTAGNRPQVVIATKSEEGLYRIEMAIPWSLYGVTPSANKHYGFVLSVNDNDDANNNVQQSMVSSSTRRRFTDPTTWNELILSN